MTVENVHANSEFVLALSKKVKSHSSSEDIKISMELSKYYVVHCYPSSIAHMAAHLASGYCSRCGQA